MPGTSALNSVPSTVVLPPVLPGLGEAGHVGPGVQVEAIVLGWRACEPIILAGIPPSWHINWACLPTLPPLEG